MKMFRLWNYWQYRNYRHMWIVDRNQWFLAEMKAPDGRDFGYAILHIKSGAPRFDNPKVAAYISEQMRKAGARVLTYNQWNEEQDNLLRARRITPKPHDML